MTRSFCPDGHESWFWNEVEPEPALTDGPVATCPVAGCGLLIRFCDWCDRPGTGWATVDPTGDDGEPHEPHESVIHACGLHLNLLTSGVHPPCVVCGEPVDCAERVGMPALCADGGVGVVSLAGYVILIIGWITLAVIFGPIVGGLLRATREAQEAEFGGWDK